MINQLDSLLCHRKFIFFFFKNLFSKLAFWQISKSNLFFPLKSHCSLAKRFPLHQLNSTYLIFYIKNILFMINVLNCFDKIKMCEQKALKK